MRLIILYLFALFVLFGCQERSTSGSNSPGLHITNSSQDSLKVLIHIIGYEDDEYIQKPYCRKVYNLEPYKHYAVNIFCKNMKCYKYGDEFTTHGNDFVHKITVYD